MQISKWVTVTLTVLLLGGRVFAQSVDDIISKHIDAMGGADKLASLNTVYEETTSSIMGNDLPAKVWVVNNTGFRMEMDMMGSQMVQVANKDKGWMINPMSGNTDPQPMTDIQLKQAMQRTLLGGQLFHYKERGFTATLVGQDTVGSKQTYKIKLSKDGQPDEVYYIDATTYKIDKTTSTNYNGDTPVPLDIVFNGYQTTPDGYVFPSSYTMELPQGELVTTINKLVINQPVDTAKFQKP